MTKLNTIKDTAMMILISKVINGATMEVEDINVLTQIDDTNKNVIKRVKKTNRFIKLLIRH